MDIQIVAILGVIGMLISLFVEIAGIIVSGIVFTRTKNRAATLFLIAFILLTLNTFGYGLYPVVVVPLLGNLLDSNSLPLAMTGGSLVSTIVHAVALILIILGVAQVGRKKLSEN